MQAGGAVTVDSEWTQREADGGDVDGYRVPLESQTQEKATRSGGVATCKPLRRALWTLLGGEVALVSVKELEASEPN